LLVDATGSTTVVSIYIAALALIMIGCTLLAPGILRAEQRPDDGPPDVAPAAA